MNENDSPDKLSIQPCEKDTYLLLKVEVPPTIVFLAKLITLVIPRVLTNLLRNAMKHTTVVLLRAVKGQVIVILVVHAS